MKTNLLLIVFSLLLISSCKVNNKSTDHGWITNLEDGVKLAKKENKAVLLLFTGSDWCPPCKKLHHDVMESDEFLKFAKENLVLVMMDFPRKAQNRLDPAQSKYNNELKRKFSIRGFPTVIMLDKNGKELERWVGYRPTKLSNTLDKYKAALKK